MKLETTNITDLVVITPKVHADHRGFFLESYSEQAFAKLGLRTTFVQDNHSLSVAKNTLRGLHFQLAPFAQSKLVRVVRGAIFDVAVDLRKDSPTFKKWFGVELSAENFKMLFIPKGFAHGFCTIAENTEVMYKVDAPYSRDHDTGVAWNDPEIKIAWPTDRPILSEKDAQLKTLSETDLEAL